MRTALAFLAALAVIAPAARGSAQELNLAAATTRRPNVVLARSGLDHAFVLDLGYRRVLSFRGRPVLIGGDFGLPVASPDLADYRVRASVAATLLGGEGRGFKLTAAVAPTLRATSNAAGRARALGADLRLTVGYYASWWLAGELGLDWAASTHITHGSAYREMFPGARDGWYGNAGGTVYAGVSTGVSLKTVDVMLRAGVPRTTSLAPQTVPFYALVGVNVALPD